MSKHMTNTRTVRAALLTAAIAVAGLFVSLPAGAKDKPLNKVELKHLIANAETKADHERVAQYFDGEATKYEAEAKEHADLAPFYQKNTPSGAKYPASMQTFQHCDSLSKSLTEAAQNARALAGEHREMSHSAK